MNRIFLNTKGLPEKIFLDTKGKYSLNIIRISLYKFKQNAIAFYSITTKSIYINGDVLKKHYSNEDELIEILTRILSHEYFHYILDKHEGKEFCGLFDNHWLLNILEDYGITSLREINKLYDLHNTFIY